MLLIGVGRSVYSLAHSSQWFMYSTASLSLNLAWHHGHCNSDAFELWSQAELGDAAGAAAAAAGGGGGGVSAAVLGM